LRPDCEWRWDDDRPRSGAIGSFRGRAAWPHGNSLIALGVRHYGFDAEAAALAGDISGAASRFLLNQLPELYAGLQRDPTGFPVQYLGANVPQAWAAGSPFVLFQAMLGLQRAGEGLNPRTRRLDSEVRDDKHPSGSNLEPVRTSGADRDHPTASTLNLSSMQTRRYSQPSPLPRERRLLWPVRSPVMRWPIRLNLPSFFDVDGGVSRASHLNCKRKDIFVAITTADNRESERAFVQDRQGQRYLR